MWAALEILHEMGMIEPRGGGDPDLDLDLAPLTTMGSLAAALPIDLSLTRLLAYGVIFCCAAEAIAIVASLSLPRLPFRLVTPLVHTQPTEYNKLVSLVYKGRLHFDRGTYSEPLGMVALACELSAMHASHASAATLSRWCTDHGLSLRAIKQMQSTMCNLQRVLCKQLGLPKSDVELAHGRDFPGRGGQAAFNLARLRAL